jgi:hypothetical protein
MASVALEQITRENRIPTVLKREREKDSKKGENEKKKEERERGKREREREKRERDKERERESEWIERGVNHSSSFLVDKKKKSHF